MSKHTAAFLLLLFGGLTALAGSQNYGGTSFNGTGNLSSSSSSFTLGASGGTVATVTSQGLTYVCDTRGRSSGQTISTSATNNMATWHNTGATTEVPFELPPAAAGRCYKWDVTDADGLVIHANGSDTITLNGATSAAGGEVSSAFVGSTLNLSAVASGNWCTGTFDGDWSVDDKPATSLHATYFFSTPAATSNVAGVAIKCAGTTTAGPFRGFTVATSNRSTYDGLATKQFLVSATVSMSSAGATDAILYLAKNGTEIAGSAVTRAISNTAIAAVSIAYIVELAETDYVELWCEEDSGNDLRIESGGISISAVSRN